jgi:hypothetical protein
MQLPRLLNGPCVVRCDIGVCIIYVCDMLLSLLCLCQDKQTSDMYHVHHNGSILVFDQMTSLPTCVVGVDSDI